MFGGLAAWRILLVLLFDLLVRRDAGPVSLLLGGEARAIEKLGIWIVGVVGLGVVCGEGHRREEGG
jgi:hypothetical protein